MARLVVPLLRSMMAPLSMDCPAQVADAPEAPFQKLPVHRPVGKKGLARRLSAEPTKVAKRGAASAGPTSARATSSPPHARDLFESMVGLPSFCRLPYSHPPGQPGME